MKNKTLLKNFSIIAIFTIIILLFTGVNKVYAEENTAVQNVIKQISSLNIQIDTRYATYTGKKLTRPVAIYDGNTKLVEGKDYNVTFKNNKKTGKAIIKIKGTGNYTGTVEKYFYIVPKKATIKDVIFSSNFKKATIEWKKDKQASGYVIYMATKKDGEYKKVKKIKKNKITQYTVKKLNPNKMYYFKIWSYKTIEEKNCYSNKMSKSKSSKGKIAKISLVSYSSGSNRKHNLKKACKAINGTILKPGETFNWFKVVGPASGKRGYKKAMVFRGKTKRALDYGGGVCQVSSTLYQAALQSNLKVLERHEHSQPVSYAKKGKDATVTYGVNNLKFKNTKNYKIKLVTYAEEGRTTCEMYRISD